MPGNAGSEFCPDEVEGIDGCEGDRSLNATQAPCAACFAPKKLVLTILPIHAVPFPGPKQLHANDRAETVGDAAGGDGTATSDGTPSLGTGAGSCAGALGGATGASNGFGAGNCAHTLTRLGGQHSVMMKLAAITTAAMNFSMRNATLPLDSSVTILERVSAFGYNRAHDTLQVRLHFASVRGPMGRGLLPACLR